MDLPKVPWLAFWSPGISLTFSGLVWFSGILIPFKPKELSVPGVSNGVLLEGF